MKILCIPISLLMNICIYSSNHMPTENHMLLLSTDRDGCRLLRADLKRYDFPTKKTYGQLFREAEERKGSITMVFCVSSLINNETIKALYPQATFNWLKINDFLGKVHRLEFYTLNYSGAELVIEKRLQ